MHKTIPLHVNQERMRVTMRPLGPLSCPVAFLDGYWRRKGSIQKHCFGSTLGMQLFNSTGGLTELVEPVRSGMLDTVDNT